MYRKLYTLPMLALLTALAFPAFAHHRESNNSLSFVPVAGSPSPGASGKGVVNFVLGASGETADESKWKATFNFKGLEPGTEYTVAVRGGLGTDPMAFSGICNFMTNVSGIGVCQNQFSGLQRLDVVQLRVGDENGQPVLQATRQATASGPGTIVSRGGCREEGGETCEAPGRQ